MRDFDIERAERQALPREREFKLDGQIFTAHLDVRPEIITAYLGARTFSDEFLAAADKLFEAYLTAESWERFRELRARDTDPVTLVDLGAVANWLISEETARPSRASSGSTPGRATSGTTSTDASTPPATATEPTGSLSAVS